MEFSTKELKMIGVALEEIIDSINEVLRDNHPDNFTEAESLADHERLLEKIDAEINGRTRQQDVLMIRDKALEAQVPPEFFDSLRVYYENLDPDNDYDLDIG